MPDRTPRNPDRTLPARPQHGDGWRIQPADEALLTDLTRYGTMTFRQARQRFYGGVERTTDRRIGYLRKAGLLAVSRDHEWAGRLLLGTSTGHTLIRDNLTVPLSASVRDPGERLLHKLAVTDAGMRFEQRGEVVLTERELRTAEGTSDVRETLAATLGVPLRSSRDGRGIDRRFCVPVGSRGAVHYPDLIVVTPEGLVAVEVEIAVKTMSKLREILRGYRDSGIFNQVVYFTTARVGALLHGWRDDDGDWAPGVLQQVALLPDGPPNYGPESRVRVRPCHPRDPGVAYQLDKRQIPRSWHVDRSEWRLLRDGWAADSDLGKAAGVPFLRWWRDIEIPRRQATETRWTA
ncbi:hypothetical protein ASG90_02335 [Nocardioides sp. Soil797]|nr:hypothetical protein ASG90_02335 [Nocardioides sp. Soil797]